MSAVASHITGISIVRPPICSKKTSKLIITGLCEGNPPMTGGFPSQRASNTEYGHRVCETILTPCVIYMRRNDIEYNYISIFAREI